MANSKVLKCPVCGYRNRPDAWRCNGTIIVRGDQKKTCGKDLTAEEPTAAREDLAVHGPGGGA